MGQPAILLDRDGVINVNRDDHVKSWNEFEFLPGVVEALVALSRYQIPIAIVSNQAVVNRGIISIEDLNAIHERMLEHIRAAGARIDSVFFCPHDTSERCGCRKPEPGMLLEAARRFDVDLRRSVFVGDATTDIQAGKRAECQTVLVLTGRGRASMSAVRKDPSLVPDVVADDLYQAVPAVTQLLFRESVPGWSPVFIPEPAIPAAMD